MKTMRRIFLFTFGGIGLLFTCVGGGMLLSLAHRGLSLFSSAGMDEDTLDLLICGWTFLPMGVTFLGVGLGIHIGFRRAEARREDLALYGTRVRGTVERIALNPSLKVNRRSPYRVYVTCTPPQSTAPVTLRSHNVFAPGVQPGDEVWICFDPMNDRKYAVELPGEEDQPWA